MSTANTIIKTGTAASSLITTTSPTLDLYGTDTTKQVVNVLSNTYMYDYNGTTVADNSNYIQAIITFELLSALLDSAPSGNTPVLFMVNVTVTGKPNKKYVVDAQIQTKGNSAMSPTYVTTTTTKGSDGLVAFPVTNFFNVSSPGAPYTLTITLTQVQ